MSGGGQRSGQDSGPDRGRAGGPGGASAGRTGGASADGTVDGRRGGRAGWLAQVGADPQARARQIGHAHSAFVATRELSSDSGAGLRTVVAESWLRSATAQVDQTTDPPVTLTDGDLADYRAAHPLARVIDVLRQIVGTAVDDGDHLMAVTDASGRLLWVEGNREARVSAARMNFVEGALWDEAHAGTNAPGTAIALDHEVQIFATEHFRQSVQAWTCAAAPIHDPATGRIIGAIDVTGGDIVANPHSLALVRAAARACEAALWVPGPAALSRLGPSRNGRSAGRSAVRSDSRSAARSGGTGVPADPPATAAPRLRALGCHEGVLRRAGSADTRLTRRHTELLIMLTLHQEGLSGEQLSELLYDTPPSPTTLRVELTRLRRIVGELVDSRPYRLTGPLDADYLDVTAALRQGDLGAALDSYAGPLLPSSEAPAVAAHRNWIDTQLRAAVLASGCPDRLRTWADGPGFDDLQVWERLMAVAPTGSPCRGVAVARVRELRAEWGL